MSNMFKIFQVKVLFVYDCKVFFTREHNLSPTESEGIVEYGPVYTGLIVGRQKAKMFKPWVITDSVDITIPFFGTKPFHT